VPNNRAKVLNAALITLGGGATVAATTAGMAADPVAPRGLFCTSVELVSADVDETAEAATGRVALTADVLVDGVPEDTCLRAFGAAAGDTADLWCEPAPTLTAGFVAALGAAASASEL
jgi:hypothetical protein